jgi:hypothetical protein
MGGESYQEAGRIPVTPGFGSSNEQSRPGLGLLCGGGADEYFIDPRFHAETHLFTRVPSSG